MWKKEGTPEPDVMPRVEPMAPERAAPARVGGERATIGPSITIRGEVSGDEDLLIQGRVDGSVSLKQHAVTVGREGQIKADITARLITIEGSVEGDITADEQVMLRGSARVQGDIKAPRVVLEDGARFRGGVDMGDIAEPAARPAATARAGGADSALRTSPGAAHAAAQGAAQAAPLPR